MSRAYRECLRWVQLELPRLKRFCAAMPLAPAPQARLQSYTQKAGEALAQRDAAKHHIA